MVVSENKLLKAVIKHDGNHSKAAKALGIKQQSVTDRIKRNPHIQKAVLNAREQALKEAGLTRSRIYKKISHHLDAKQFTIVDGKVKKTSAPDYHVQKEAYKTALQLHRDLKDEDNETPISSIGALVFNIISSNKREVIDVA